MLVLSQLPSWYSHAAPPPLAWQRRASRLSTAMDEVSIAYLRHGGMLGAALASAPRLRPPQRLHPAAAAAGARGWPQAGGEKAGLPLRPQSLPVLPLTRIQPRRPPARGAPAATHPACRAPSAQRWQRGRRRSVPLQPAARPPGSLGSHCTHRAAACSVRWRFSAHGTARRLRCCGCCCGPPRVPAGLAPCSAAPAPQPLAHSLVHCV